MNKSILKYRTLLILLALSLSFSGCEDYFGEETDLDFIEVPEQTFREVAYVPIQPILNDFISPTDIIAGFDELIYVVDSATQEVIALDEAGRVLSRKFVRGARAIAQDRRLDLLVIGVKDTLGAERSCIYRLDLSTSAGYGLQYATISNEIIHPFYFKSTVITRDADVKFNRISVMGDNTYYVTRTGPSNLPTQSGGPDDAVLLFDASDDFETPIVISNSSGAIFLDYFKAPFAISSLAKPPQLSTDLRKDFLYTSLDPNGVLKVQYIENLSSVDGSSYLPFTNWNNDTSLADDFINVPFKFKDPVGVEITGDGSNFFFVVDKGTDSLYQFTSNGLEGVQPPPASGETKYIKASFGGLGNGPTQFNNPTAVAFRNDVVYVADQGNGRVLRFKLTLDIR